MYTHATILQPFFWDHPGEPVADEIKNFLWTFMVQVQGKITEADTPIIRLGAAPSGAGPISCPFLSSPHFYARCPSCCNRRTLSYLGTGSKYAGLHTHGD